MLIGAQTVINSSKDLIIGTQINFNNATNSSFIGAASTQNLRYAADGIHYFDTYNGGWGTRAQIGDNYLNLGASVILQMNGTTVIDASRNLTNIGTIASGAITSTGTLTVDAGSSGTIEFGNVTTAYGRLYADNSGTFIGSKSNHDLILRTNNTEQVRIDTSGRVGINQSPLANNFALQVTGLGGGSGDARAVYLKGSGTHTSIGGTGPTLTLQNTNNTANNIVKLSFESAGSGETVSINAINTNHGSHYGDMAFNTRGSGGYSEKMRIMANGNVGIGTSTPQKKVHIEHAAGASEGILISGPSDTNGHTAGILLRAEGGEADSALRAKAGIFLERTATYGIGKLHIANRHNSDNVSATISDANITIYDNKVGIGIATPTQKLDVAGTALVENAKLKAIAESNTDAAVDVFIYDTRKDSDGGAWRKRTQNTSWYNETLNTSIRGARKEFPSVAVIVAKSGAITIYDGDDPDMPMWMVFNGNSLVYGSVTAGLEILNGIMFFTGNVSCSEVNFITEFMGLHQATSISQSKAAWRGGILHRNSTAGSWRTEGAGTGSVIQTGTLINQSTNDIAMVVLPNAPINAATGLPVPTIALATNGGISIIKDNGIVVDIVNTQDSSTFNFCQDVHFRSDGAIVWSADSTGNSAAPRFIHVLHEIPSKDFVHIVVANPSNTDEFYSRSNTAGDLKFPSSAGVKALQNSTGITNVGTVDGLSNFAYNKIAPEEGLANYITSDYNTGYQVGNIKLAALSDTDTTTPASTNIVTNGTFGSTSNWTGISGATTAITGGAMVFTAGGGYGGFYQSLGALTAGKSYTLSFDVTSYTTGSPAFSLADTSFGVSFNSTGSYSFVTAPIVGNDPYIRLYAPASSAFTIDNVSVVVAESDRSVNGNGLAVHGTITKTAVATGADLVGYSGWSTSNFLRHSTVANYGSPATISFMGWQKTSAITNYQYMGSLQDGTSGRIIGMSIQAASVSDAGKPYFYDNTNSSLDGTIRVDDGQWHFCVGVLDGTSKKLYIDGELNASATVTALAMTNITDTRVGFFASSVGGGVNYPHLGSVALLRLSGTAPTAEQIKKIYNDEKFLFQENAKATLHGTSDAVTALAYDEDTELLHVGTSAGRSEFQGLRRVHNTTDAVGAAISASNGFIVEE